MRASLFRGWVADEPPELSIADERLRRSERRSPWIGWLICLWFGSAEVGAAIWLALWVHGLVAS